MIEKIGLIAAVALPLWNIPLIIRIGQRKSSKDISLAWVLGVEGCLVAMLPSGIMSADPVFKTFTIVNFMLFSAVLIQVLKWH